MDIDKIQIAWEPDDGNEELIEQDVDMAPMAVASGLSEYPLVNRTVGDENGAIRCLFFVCKRLFCGQKVDQNCEWLVQAHSIEAFREYLWELIRPHIKRPVKFDEPEVRRYVAVSWDEPAHPTIQDAGRYVLFSLKEQRRNFSWDSLTPRKLITWNSGTILLSIQVYSNAVTCRQAYESVMHTLLASPRPAKKAEPPKKVSKVLPEDADGYNFRDEVRALRETFMQMRDLMHILDNRISLLEEKCDQLVQKEPYIQLQQGAIPVQVVDVKDLGFLDPLLQPNVEIKQEDDPEQYD
ncbi:uncharacterized protein LOC129760136 [Uranotaenia lowii]|uniref:uncharacterized protein LOC129760136 n=1 Tax=Uranotaenia lowii TaxID=190385 RepID=UPI002478DD90|nr:uncharacterized protein LOC129760136 [Uranotaenia lowii]